MRNHLEKDFYVVINNHILYVSNMNETNIVDVQKAHEMNCDVDCTQQTRTFNPTENSSFFK